MGADNVTEEKQRKDMTDEELLCEYKKTGDLSVRNEIVLRYVSVVTALAVNCKRVYSFFMDQEDMENEAIIWLIQLIEKYDPNRNRRFFPFVYERIQWKILDLRRKYLRKGTTAKYDLAKINHAEAVLVKTSGVSPTKADIAGYLGVTLTELERMIEGTGVISNTSLDHMLEGDEVQEGACILRNSSVSEQPEDCYMDKEFKQKLIDGIHTLPNQYQIALSLYYEKGLKQKEIAEVFGVSTPRVNQILKKAVEMLREYLNDY